ncbi:MAG: hypothetical protein AAGC44_10270 [Planctomycetota bacterium]
MTYPFAHPTRLALVLALLLLPGCGSLLVQNSALSVVSRDDTTLRLQGDFDRAYYTYNEPNAVTIVLIEGPEDEPIQAAAIRMLWKPSAGLTPINPDSTNATIQYVVFANRRTEQGFFQEVGVYSGAGYLYLDDEPGSSQLTGSLWQADILLADRSGYFKDLLGQSTLRGSFTARRDDARVGDLLRLLNNRVSDRLGYPRLVDTQGPAESKSLADRR